MTDTGALEELSRLLPFYLNGSLPPAERARVEAGLAGSDTLRAELEEHRRLLVLVKQGAAPWALGQERAAPSVAADPPRSPRSALAYLSPANWNPAVSLALALAVGAQAVALLWQGRTINALRQENYELAAGKDPLPEKGSILVELQDGAAWGQVVELFAREDVSIVSGGDFGALILHSDKQGAELTAQIQRLRASGLIASVDPAK